MTPGATASGLALGYTLDVLVADPRRFHPVAGFGRVAAMVERRVHRDSRVAGTAYAAGLTALGCLAGMGLSTAARRPVAQVVMTAVCTWTVVGGTSLRREAAHLQHLLEAGETAAARVRLSHLCGRDPAALDPAGIARAVVESVAENTSDAVVGPLLWGAVGGVPGLLGYRVVNTLDAMVGHRSPRYLHFGWAAARLDDVANLLPARVTAVLVVLCAPLVDGRPRDAALACWRDGGRHPSPNAGPVEAAFAGALGRTLGGRLAYSGRTEDRPLLGDGPAPGVGDIARAARLSAGVSVTAAALAVCLRAGLERRRTRSRRPPRLPGPTLLRRPTYPLRPIRLRRSVL